MTIGERIKQRRIELNLSQEELARKLGYKSRSSINKIELSRTLPTSKIETMAAALETTPAYLMGWDNPELNNCLVLLDPYNPNNKEGLIHGTHTTKKELKEKYSIVDESDLYHYIFKYFLSTFPDADPNKVDSVTRLLVEQIHLTGKHLLS